MAVASKSVNAALRCACNSSTGGATDNGETAPGVAVFRRTSLAAAAADQPWSSNRCMALTRPTSVSP